MHRYAYIHSERLLVSTLEAARMVGQQRDLAMLKVGENLETDHVFEV